jgi:hypothetical protein
VIHSRVQLSSPIRTTIYLGDFGNEIVLDCGMDVSASTSRIIEARKPDGSVVTWSAALEGTNAIRYITVAGDIDQVGIWLLQALVGISGWSAHGETAQLHILEPFMPPG